MVTLKVESNIRDVELGMRVLGKNFAKGIRNALSDTAFAARQEVVSRTFPSAFPNAPKTWPRAIMKVEKATTQSLAASVYDKTMVDYLPRQETGGVKRPKRSRMIAVPTKDVKKTRRGLPRKGFAPADLLAAGGRGFVMRRGGRLLIFQRTGKARLPVRAMYTLVRQARIRPVLKFTLDISAFARKRFVNEFRDEIEHTIRKQKGFW